MSLKDLQNKGFVHLGFPIRLIAWVSIEAQDNNEYSPARGHWQRICKEGGVVCCIRCSRFGGDARLS
jgi:hypothetical protein